MLFIYGLLLFKHLVCSIYPGRNKRIIMAYFINGFPVYIVYLPGANKAIMLVVGYWLR